MQKLSIDVSVFLRSFFLIKKNQKIKAQLLGDPRRVRVRSKGRRRASHQRLLLVLGAFADNHNSLLSIM
jgi:hypothetical protein